MYPKEIGVPLIYAKVISLILTVIHTVVFRVDGKLQIEVVRNFHFNYLITIGNVGKAFLHIN